MPPIPSTRAQRKGKLTKKMVCAEVHSDVNGQHQLLPASISSPPQANKSSRIRVVGSRIYDSVNGKSCHQVIFPLLFSLLLSSKIVEETHRGLRCFNFNCYYNFLHFLRKPNRFEQDSICCSLPLAFFLRILL